MRSKDAPSFPVASWKCCSSGSILPNASGGESSPSSIGKAPSDNGVPSRRRHSDRLSWRSNTSPLRTRPPARTSGRAVNRNTRCIRRRRSPRSMQALSEGRNRLAARRRRAARHGGVGPFQSREPEFGRRVGVLQGIDDLLGRVIVRRSLAGDPSLKQRRCFRVLAAIAWRLRGRGRRGSKIVPCVQIRSRPPGRPFPGRPFAASGLEVF